MRSPYRHPILLICGIFWLGVLLASGAEADRRPVLEQIDEPHDYYFREMYLPQLTTGPGSLAWLPDGSGLVYSMQGSLWRQSVDSDTAEQLTAGPGYDFQPDVAADGRRVVFVRYGADAMELNLLDLETGTVTPLTDGGAVNVDPRWSPDGSRLAFVSTSGNGRFHVYTGELVDGRLAAGPILEERESPVPRYYYSQFDHELSPAWLPDGKSLLYVGNRDVPYGTGNLWMIELRPEAQPQLVRREETTWKARPDVSPDGRRVAYASYLGRQWHQLWVLGIDGAAEPFPLTYGEFDVTSPRWSPDASRIAYISNEGGNTGIRIRETVGGRTTTMIAAKRVYRQTMLDFDLRVVDSAGAPVAARVSVLASDGRGYAPWSALIHADDSFDRERAGFETKYFHTDGYSRLELPAGATRVTVWHGPEYRIVEKLVNLSADRDNWMTVTLEPLDLPAGWGSRVGADVHAHMNYGGTYRMTPARLVRQARAEDLDIVFNLIVNKEQRVPDIAYFSTEPDAASDDNTVLVHAQEFHTSVWGHLGLLGLRDHLLIPDYAGYPGTAAASLYPDNATIARLARAQGAAVGYVHPFYWPPPDPESDAPLTSALPVDAALGLVDYYEVLGFADHRASAAVWYRLLNCGLRIAAAGGTDAMTNYASLRGPVGLNRTYVRIADRPAGAAARRDAWLAGLRAGRTMATNAPLLGLTVDGVAPGGEIRADGAKRKLHFDAWMRSAVPVDHLELVFNGEVVESIDPEDDRLSADTEGRIAVRESGWLLLRAWNDEADPRVFDIYPYATTSPVYVTLDGRPPRSTADAAYFIAWIDKLRTFAAGHPAYNSTKERESVLAGIDRATAFYETCRAD